MKIKLHFMTTYSNAENQPIPMGSHIFSWHYIIVVVILYFWET